MSELSPLQRWCCGHSVTTEADEKGQALCTRCGALLQVKLTREFLTRSLEQALRHD